jgi:enamine deaminase RidA (YjgF/YER057c/UK114 family)
VPAGSYALAIRSGNLLFVSGQTWKHEGRTSDVGAVPTDVPIARAQLAARHCVLACLAEVRAAEGSLDRISRVIRVNGFVRSAPGFAEQPAVINGASDVLLEIFGEAGRHARTSIGVAELPDGASVEVDAIFELRDASDADVSL